MVQASGAEVEVPPTLQALLTARLDQLDRPERSVLERGAVEGEVFHQGVVQVLMPDEPRLTSQLTLLVRKELISPDRPLFAGEDAFRFRHLLMRDAAYEALPKAERAELHERFAGWLEQHGDELVELDELLGYHLEQAYRYRQELGRPTRSEMRSRPGPESGWHAPEAGQSCDTTTTQVSTCSSGRPGCSPTRGGTRGSRSTSAGRVSTRDRAWRPYRAWPRLPIAQRRAATALPSSACASSGRTSSSCSCLLRTPRRGNSASSPSRRFRCSRRPATNGGSRSRVAHF